MTDWSGEDYAKVSSIQRTMIEEAKARLALAEADRVLDVGCGDGYLTREMAGMVPGGYAVGVDASKRMISTADAAGSPAESGPWFAVADARRLPFGEHFDVVVSFNALHWVPQQRQALGQIATVLRPGGRAVIQVVCAGEQTSLEAVAMETCRSPRWAHWSEVAAADPGDCSVDLGNALDQSGECSQNNRRVGFVRGAEPGKLWFVPRISGRVHVVRVKKTHVDARGRRREYSSAYLRRTYREGKRVRNETVADLSMLPEHVVDGIDAGLKGAQLVPAGGEFTICRSLPHGHVAAVAAMAHQLGFPALLGPACRARDLALALIISRVLRPGPKLSTLAWWPDTTLGVDLGVADASTDEVYTAMDWLADRQGGIEKQLAARHLDPSVNPTRMALFDLSSSWVTGRCCELAARGYSRDAKKGCEQIEYGVLTDAEGRPVAVRVFEGNTADPTAFTEIVAVIRDKFGLDRLVLVGDRGMITTARITALRELNDSGTGFDWITALRAPAVAKLAAEDGPLQISLFDTHHLAEITHPDYPGERLIAGRNPPLAADRARKRDELLTATEKLLNPIIARVAAGRLSGAGAIGEAVGRVIDKYKVGKHFHRTITDTSLTVKRRHDQIAAEAALDGIYVLRTSVPADQLDAAGAVIGYKNLANVERDFRIIKVDDLDLRPIHHRLTDRVRAHVLICMLACYLVWHLRQAWAPMTFTDEHPPQRDNPVGPAQRSPGADAKASQQHDPAGNPLRSFRGLLDHLATLTRNQVRYHDTSTEIPMLTEATPDQRRAFDLIDAPIPLTAA